MKVYYMAICPKCASFKMNATCKFCNVKRIDTDTTLDEARKLTAEEEEKLIKHYIETLIKDTYDPEARKYREENERPPFADYVPSSGVSCPYCHSSNTRKISGLSKAASVALVGKYAIGRVSKEWHCNSCGSEF